MCCFGPMFPPFRCAARHLCQRFCAHLHCLCLSTASLRIRRYAVVRFVPCICFAFIYLPGSLAWALISLCATHLCINATREIFMDFYCNIIECHISLWLLKAFWCGTVLSCAPPPPSLCQCCIGSSVKVAAF